MDFFIPKDLTLSSDGGKSFVRMAGMQEQQRQDNPLMRDFFSLRL
jgi:hypothetical protein